MLFHKKPEKKILELSRQETRLLREGLMHFRHKVVEMEYPTEDIDALLAKLVGR